MLVALRSAVFAIVCSVVLVPWALVVLLASLAASADRIYWMCAGYLRVCIAAARIICGIDYRVHGMHHLPAVGSLDPVILCCKHQSTWETFAMPAIMSHPLAYVFKRELLRIPFFGWAMARMDMIHIDRSNRVEAWAKVAEQGKRLLGRGVWVIMFPEGTRAARGEKGSYKTGATRLAVATGAAVVPIAVSSAKCWPRKSLLLRPGVVDVVIGAPIPSKGREADELMLEVERWIETEMHRIDPEAYAGKPQPSGAQPV